MTTEAVLDAVRDARRQALLEQVRAEMRREAEIDDVYEGREDLTRFVPHPLGSPTWAAWLRRNRTGRNEFRRAVERLLAPLNAARLQWTGDEGWPPGPGLIGARALTRRLAALAPLIARDLVLKGKAAVLPWRDASGAARLSLLGSHLHPIWDDVEVTELERLLVFQPYQASDGALYLVWELEPGVVRLRDRVSDPTAYAARPARSFPQRHAPHRSPAAFAHLQRDARRAAEGLAEPALAAHYLYRQRMIQENASFELTGMPQRVASGDGVDAARLASFAPYQTLVLPENGRLEYPYPAAALERLSAARREAARSVALALHAPEVTDGAGESGQARVVSLEELTSAATAVGASTARLLSEASELLALMTELPGPLEFSLAPQAAAQDAARQAAVTAMFQVGLLSRHEALVRLQALGLEVSEAELERALAEQARP